MRRRERKGERRGGKGSKRKVWGKKENEHWERRLGQKMACEE